MYELENIFRNFFSKMQPNIVKYFPKIIFQKIFYGKTNTPSNSIRERNITQKKKNYRALLAYLLHS